MYCGYRVTLLRKAMQIKISGFLKKCCSNFIETGQQWFFPRVNSDTDLCDLLHTKNNDVLKRNILVLKDLLIPETRCLRFGHFSTSCKQTKKVNIINEAVLAPTYRQYTLHISK